MSSPRSVRVSLPASTTRYLIEAKVGGGGMGEIFRAIDQTTGEPVAIKLLRSGTSPHEEARFRREVAVLADLRHPNVVRYIDHGVWPGGRSFLAMEWLDGEDMEARRKREPPGMDDAVEAIRRAAAALAAVHARGVVHRDIKLANLWLCGGRIQRVKLIDFGVVKLPEDDGFSTQPGAIVGTPFHMAPEQARNEPITPRSDVYSLGSVLFLLLTGRLVFPSEHLVALLGRLVLEDAPRVSSLRPDVPEALDLLVARCLEREAAGRFQDAGELSRALARVGTLHNEPPPAGRPAARLSSPRLRAAEQGPPSRAPGRGALGSSGKRLVAVVLASLEQGLLPKELRRALRGVMSGGDHVEPIRGERLVLVLGLTASQGGEALRAARAALLISRLAPGARVALASGHVREAEQGLSAETLERAAWLLEQTAAGEVRIDRETAPLLGTRFQLQDDNLGMTLQGEEDGPGRTRQLLGRPTPTVGRAEEFAALATAFQETLGDGTPRAVLVSGPAGIGKSRLRYELTRWLRAHPEAPDILLCRGDPLSDRSGLSLLGRALRGRAGIFDGEDPVRQRGKLRGFLGPLLGQDPRSELFLGELLGVRGGEADEGLLAARQEPALMLGRLQGAFEALLRVDGRRAAQVLILEDCHWVDELTRSLVGWALASSGLRFVVFAFARPELDPATLAWSLARCIDLGPLESEDARRLVRDALPALDGDTTEAIVERAGGNALFLEELIRYAAEGHQGLPLTVQALVQVRLDAMAPALRGVARAASVFGRACWAEGVTALLGEESEEALDALAESEILTENEASRFAGQREWTFRHALVREAVYASLLDEDRVKFHGRAALWLEVAGEEDLATLAWHVAQSGDRSRAGELYARATTQAQAAGYLDSVLALADGGLACTEEPELRGKLLAAKARAAGWLGLYGEALALAREAQGLCPRGGDSWASAVRVQSSALRDLGRQHESEQVLAAALAHEALFVEGTLGLLLSERARTLADLGRLPEARRAADRACQLAEQTKIGYETARLRAEDARFFVVASQGHLVEQIEACLAVVRLADAAGDVPLGTRARCNLGHCLNCLGRFEEALDALSQAAADAVRSRLLPLHGFALHNLGLSLARLGRFDEAISHQQGARSLAEQMGHERLRASSLQYEALVVAWQGRSLDQALLLAREASRVAAQQPSQRLLALRVLAFVQQRRGVQEAALEVLSEPGVLPEGSGAPEWGGLARLTQIEAHLALGERPRARGLLRRAAIAVLEEAHALPKEHQQGFLERIEENRRTLELARHLGVS
jgi:tetratricopeptide (TPR) repeat protein